MSGTATRRRVSKRTATAAVAKRAGARRQKSASVPRKGNAADVESAGAANACLEAQFAAALGAKFSKVRRKSRSLAQALSGISAMAACRVSTIDLMPGARVLPLSSRQTDAQGDGPTLAPCSHVHRRNRARRLLASFGGWSAALAMTVLIVGATVAGVRSFAPQTSQTMASASATQF